MFLFALYVSRLDSVHFEVQLEKSMLPVFGRSFEDQSRAQSPERGVVATRLRYLLIRLQLRRTADTPPGSSISGEVELQAFWLPPQPPVYAHGCRLVHRG